MYRYQEGDDVDQDGYYILDPDGDCLATVYSMAEAEALVSHLNRG
jgi:hypothetical protein